MGVHCAVVQVVRLSRPITDALARSTRYRDLLTSASQITSLHSSSLRLSSGLRTVSAACANPTEMADTSSETMDTEDVNAMLPVAAHMKFLLDAPEALYAYLAHHAYLNAAFLWLVARVVKEGMSAMPEETKGMYTPLLQKQWEVLVPFRAQIVQRATAALRTRDNLTPKLVSETLLAIILLDSLPLPDALDLLLSQRLKALRDILAHVPTSTKNNLRRKSSNSRLDNAASTREAAHQRQDIVKVISEAVRCLLGSVALVKGAFEPKRRGPGEESALAEAIRLVQAGEEPQATLQPTPLRRASHQRRASRMASISLPLPPRINATSTGPPLSSPQIIQSLPSSQILLRYLPASVIEFTPFIAPSTPPSLAAKLGPWQASAVDTVRESAPAWLDGLHSVADVWAVRATLADMLGDEAFEEQISAALEAEWGARVQAIWTAKLNAIVTSAETSLNDAADRIRSGAVVSDNEPETHMFADIAFPSAAGIAGSGAGFNSFLASLMRRSSYRTPILDEVLSGLESSASDIKADLTDLPSTLYDDYRGKLSVALAALVGVLRDTLSSVGGHRDAKGSVEAELFVGRVALYLAHTSSFLTDLVGTTGVDVDKTKASLMDVHSASTIQWQTQTMDTAVHSLAPLFADHRGADHTRATWQGTFPSAPSPQVMSALTLLVGAVRHLGIPAGLSLQTLPKLVTTFVAAVRDMSGWKGLDGEAAAQAAVDLGFLALLNGDTVEKDAATLAALGTLPSSYDEFKSNLPAILLESLRRVQLLLSPLTSHLNLAPSVPSATAASRTDRSAALLPLGAPALAARSAGVGAEFRSPIAVAKLGKRFGLLSIVA